jgi:predicted nucleotidyltransferase
LADTNISPTPYGEINLFLQVLLDNLRTVLGDYFIGMYLFGSLAIGDFDHGRSDIDFLVVTHELLPDRLLSALKRMHTSIYESGLEWGTKLEGAYIPLDAVREYSSSGPVCPLVNRNVFIIARPEANWVINRYVLYTRGIVVVGPPLHNILDPVEPEQLQESVMTLLRNNWTPWLQNPDLFLSVEYAQPFVVLNMCRSLYIIECGSVVSKKWAAEWVMNKLDAKWAQLVKQALEWRSGDPPGNVRQTQEFMSYIFNRVGLK